ncbi:MAG TPA: CPBP family intramembrane glutamic endopeptidase [Gemmatimonadales bacterium]
MRSLTGSLLSLALIAAPVPLPAQGSVAPRPRGGAEFGIPLASFLVPGLGQYLEGSWLAGAGFTATAAGGYALYFTGDQHAASVEDLPRDPDGQRAFIGAQLAQAAGELSAYDSFHRSLPLLQRVGKYDFVKTHESTASLLSAPFDLRMLKRWTTWIDLAHAAVVTALVLAETEPGARYVPFRTRDGAFVASFSYNAGVGEEALFRGWLYPVLHQKLGRRAWLSNGVQAAVFGGLHVSQAGPFALDITASALYEGWLTRRNGWSIRESIFHHFWYDVAVGAATLLTQKSGTVGVAIPVRF